jgi:5-methylcytosine-specific restriction endonuclease McrBC regulatory subunit McrC
MENEKFKERRKKTKKVGVLISMKMLYQAWVRAWLE